MIFTDRLTLDATKRTKDGYLAGRARVARSGLYDYAGSEVDPENKHGLRDNAVVKVYRPGDEVFSADSLRSFIGKPITNDHPTEAVTADNWRKHARGTIMGAVRDGEYVGFDYLITDAALIADIEAGKRELSNGYSVALDFAAGTTPEGQAYDAVQRTIRGNHLAVVRVGRAGSECAIKDGVPVCDAIAADEISRLAALLTTDERTGTMPHTLMIDGLQVPNVSDEAKACIEKLQGQVTAANTALADANSKTETLTGEKAAMQTQIDEAKAASDPAKLDQMAADRATLVTQAKAIAPAVTTDGKSAADIRRAVVAAKIGDAAQMSDEAVSGAFAMLAKDAAPAKDAVTNIAPAALVADNANVVSAIRAARYAA